MLFPKYLVFFVFLRIILFSQPQSTKKIPEPIKTSRDVETRKQTVHTTLIRDQNGLGFTISGGKGSPAYKENSDVRKCLFTVQVIARMITQGAIFSSINALALSHWFVGKCEISKHGASHWSAPHLMFLSSGFLSPH